MALCYPDGGGWKFQKQLGRATAASVLRALSLDVYAVRQLPGSFGSSLALAAPRQVIVLHFADEKIVNG